ncbi:MAG: DNA polymerase IV [Syntrophales bacterium]
MDNTIFSLHSWPQAILHIDGDAFFTSCEEILHPELKGKPVITGAERGIVACASYPAKKIGIKRGVSLSDAKIICPGLVVLPSDYETYSLFSRRMFMIVRRFTPQVEEYSIDEAFADITGLRRPLRSSYEAIAKKIKDEIQREIGFSVSVGLSLTKVLAKVGSKYRKPNGLTVIPGRSIATFLEDLPVNKIWGIGPATKAHLNKIGIGTALEFARMPEQSIRKSFTKPTIEIWQELRGQSVCPVISEEKSTYASISKTKTFAPSTSDADYLFAQLLRNLESACIKARRYKLAPLRVALFLKTNNFLYSGCEVRLNRPSSYPMDLADLVRDAFNGLYRKRILYRATGVVLMEMCPDLPVQYSLFDDAVRADKVRTLYEAMDEISRRFGKHTLHLGGSHIIEVLGKGKRGASTARESTQFLGETKRQHLGLPILHVKV